MRMVKVLVIITNTDTHFPGSFFLKCEPDHLHNVLYFTLRLLLLLFISLIDGV